MNSPNNNYTFSLFIKKLLLIILIGGGIFFQNMIVFGQEIEPNGHNVFYYPNGKVASEGEFKNNVPVGIWKSYYQDGTLKSIGKKNKGLSDSVWVFYDTEGRKTKKYIYEEDLKNGCAVIYDTLGNVVEEVFYIDDVPQGEQLTFYPDGSIKSRVNLKDGKRIGEFIAYAENGDIITESIYDNGYLKEKKEYNRYDENGEKTGVWRTFHSNGTVASEINYKNGKRNGLAKTFNKKGKLIDLQRMEGDSAAVNADDIVMIEMYKEYYEDGKLKLAGGLDNGRKSGIFREYDKEGNIINGYIFKNDTLLAEGIIEGNGIFQGPWKTYYKGTDKIKSEGIYLDGAKDGKWLFYYPNGKKEQEGNYKESKLQGEWKWYYPNGLLKRKEYYNNREELAGTVLEYDSLGTEITRGDYFNGRQEGEWFYHVNDFKEVGAFTLGYKDGVWKYFYLNGKIAFIGEFDEGEPKGKHIYYYRNGLKKSVGKYLGGEKHGKWKYYDEKGYELQVIQFKRGEIYKIDGFKIEEIKE
jgi:antitoxin component YwqK of YwqJK toxin-antitoxin module